MRAIKAVANFEDQHRPQSDANSFASFLWCRAAQGLVELALAVPLFTLLLVSMAALGSVVWSNIEVANAARAGAQYGAQSSTYAADTGNITTAALRDVTNLGTITVTPGTFCACANTLSSHVTCSTACASSHILKFVDVKTSVAVIPWFHPAGLRTAYNLSGESVMRVEH